MMKNWLSNKSMKFKYLMSYLAVALFSAIVLVVICFYMYINAQNSVLNSNELVLKSVKKDVDYLLQSMNNLYYSISMNQKLLSLNDLQPGSIDYTYRMFEFRSDLFNPNQELDYYIYVKNGDSIINNISARGYVQYYDNFIKKNFGYNSAEEWRLAFFTGTRNKFYRGINNDTQSEFISFVYPIPFSRTVSPTMFLVVSVNEDSFIELYKKSFNLNNCDIFVRRKTGEYLINTGETDGVDDIAIKTSSTITTDYTKKSVAMSILSQNEDYVYVVRSDKKVFWKELYPIIGFIVICFIIYVIVAFILIRFLLKVTYNPIKELMIISDSSIKKRFKQSGNEFTFIKNGILNTSERLRQAELEIKLRAFLNGKIIPKNLGELFQNEIKSENCRYFVGLFKVGDLSQLFHEETTDDNLKVENAGFVIENVLEELLTNAFASVSMIKTGEDLAAVIIIGDADYKAPFEFAVNYARDFISENFAFNFFVAASSVYNRAEDLSNAYSEVVSALEYSLLIGKDKIIYFDSLIRENNSVNSGYYFSIDFETKLENALHNENSACARGLIEQFFNINFRGENINIAILRFAIHDLMATLLKSVQEKPSVYNEILSQTEICIKNFSKNNMEELKEAVISIAEKICVGVGRNSQTMRYVSDIMSIVEQEYVNPEFGNDVIAARLGISEVYVSKLFKNRVGTNLSEYIYTLRVNKAKELLENSYMNNNEIATQSGFGNTRSFLRMFKKYAGDTPAEYRKKSKKI